MTTATQPEDQGIGVRGQGSGKTLNPKTQHLTPRALRALHAEWRKLSPEIIGPEGMTERELRLWWTNRVLGAGRNSKIENRNSQDGRVSNFEFRISSWNDLTPGQAKFLLKRMRRETGNSPLNDWIPEAALRLWGHDWDESLRHRMIERFHVGRLHDLEPAQKSALFEELCSRLARAEICSGDVPSPNWDGDHRSPLQREVAARIEEVKHDIIAAVRRRKSAVATAAPSCRGQEAEARGGQGKSTMKDERGTMNGEEILNCDW